jgi:hypothetical protein
MSVAAQLAANMTVASPAALAAAWAGCFPGTLTKLALINLDSVHGPVAMALLTCCKDSRERWAGAWCWRGVAPAAAPSCRWVRAWGCAPAARRAGAQVPQGAAGGTCKLPAVAAHACQLLWPELSAGWCCVLRRCQQLCSPAGQTVLQALLGAVMDPNAPQDAPGNE